MLLGVLSGARAWWTLWLVLLGVLLGPELPLDVLVPNGSQIFKFAFAIKVGFGDSGLSK